MFLLKWLIMIIVVSSHSPLSTTPNNNSMARLPTRTPTSILTLECCCGIMDSPSINITPCCLDFRGPLEDCASCTGIGHWACLWRGPRVTLPSGWRILRRTTPTLKRESEDGDIGNVLGELCDRCVLLMRRITAIGWYNIWNC